MPIDTLPVKSIPDLIVDGPNLKVPLSITVSKTFIDGEPTKEATKTFFGAL